MNCPKCNNPIDNKKKFCTKCGCNIEEFIKEEKEKKKTKRKEKIYKIKLKIALVLFLIFIILILVLIGLNFFGKQSHKSKEKYSVITNTTNDENSEELYNTGILVDEIELTEENKSLDYDDDGLTNEEEKQYGTSMINSDSDGDGLTDYEEIHRYNSDPTKYSTSDDNISDYIKVQRELQINRKYTPSEVKPEEVEVGYNIKLIPEDINSQYYGGLEQFNNDATINSTHNVFNLLNFKGIIEYETGNTESILLLREGKNYSEFKNYKNENGKLIITITEDDNYKDFVITTKENYENYENNQ